MQNLSKNNEFKKLTYAGKAGNSKKQTRKKLKIKILKGINKMAKTDFIPKRDGDLDVFEENFVNKLTMGWGRGNAIKLRI